MSRYGSPSANILQEEIRRQFGSTGTTRFVRSLPAFRLDSDVPNRFSSLLKELERAEGDRCHARSEPRRMSRRDSDA